jgi:hypothetical protein
MFNIVNYVIGLSAEFATQRIMLDPWVIAYGTQTFGVIALLTLAFVLLLGYLYRA